MALLGPRQIGKTSLALELGRLMPSVYLDLEAAADRAKLADPALYLSALGGARGNAVGVSCCWGPLRWS